VLFSRSTKLIENLEKIIILQKKLADYFNAKANCHWMVIFIFISQSKEISARAIKIMAICELLSK